MNDDADRQPAVAAEFLALAGLLDSTTRAVGHAIAVCGMAGPRGYRASDHGGALLRRGVHGRVAPV